MTTELPKVDIHSAISVEAAKTAGYHPMTLPYNLPFEMADLEKLVSDLVKQSCRYVLVAEKRGVAVWRK